MKKRKRLVTILFLLCLVGLGFYIYSQFFHKTRIVANKKEIDVIEEYGYSLNNMHPEIYKEYFKELKTVLKETPVDEEEYVTLISKMFIIDLYSLDIRVDQNDVGGVEFVYNDIVDSYKDKVKDTIYLYMESNLYGKRKQDLPIVKDVSVDSINNVPYYYENNTKTDQNAYEVKVSWDYEETSDYQKSATLYFVHNDKKLELVEIK